MGVPHLYTFVTKQVSNCLYDIDIIREIENWSRLHVEKPSIVIDFPAFTHAICNDKHEFVFGGRYEHCLRKTTEFLNVLKQKGVTLMFFEDGPVQVDKSENVIQRQNQKYKDIFSVLDDVYRGIPVNKLVTDHEIKPHGSLAAGIRAIARTFGEFQISYHNECDKEVARYAREVNALAIISDDTDFLIYEGDWNYWSSRHIHFYELTTKNYNKIALRQHLKLNEGEMPLFATLAGNDIIRKDLLNHFHRKLGNIWYKFPNISRYIIRNYRNLEIYEPSLIARDIFDNTNELPKHTDLVSKSLNSYNINMLTPDPNESIDNGFLHRIRNLENDSYAFLLDLARSCTISYFDMRIPEFGKYIPLALNLIRRQLGIILQHKNDSSLTRHIYCYQNHKYVFITLQPEYPPISVPDLNDLYNADKSGELKLIKLQLLIWIISERLDINAITNIERKYFCVCLTLFYMVENFFISIREADIFLHMAETVYERFSTIKDLPYLEIVDPRAFQLVYLYDKVYQQITHAISNCGLFELIEHNHMDGLYFHYAFKNMHDGAINVKKEHLRLYDCI